MRFAAEVPDKRRAFETPVVPLAILLVSEVTVLVESQTTFIQPALPFETLEGFVLIFLAIRLNERHQHELQLGLLVGAELGDRNAGEFSRRAPEGNLRLVRALLDRCLFAMLLVQ